MQSTMISLSEPYAAEDLARLVAQHGSPLLLLDCARLRRQYRRLAAALPGVQIHYALKALSHPAVVTTLRDAGGHFDLATNGEIDVVRGLGVDSGRCIHTHPIKRDGDIRAAVEFGVRLFVADSVHELPKFVPYRNDCEVLLRVGFKNPGAVVDLSSKFGASPRDVPELLATAGRLGVRVAGFATHAGSQPRTPEAHCRAIEALIELLRASLPQLHVEHPVLDIGGGLPTEYGYGAGGPTIEAFCAPIRELLSRAPPNARIITEPGRYLVAAAGTGIATVMGKAERNGRWWYYLDDGVYGLWSGQLHEPVRYPVASLRQGGARHPSVLAGPTCDSIDVIAESIELPLLEPGDLIVGETMGAYTAASACEFNLFPRARILPVNQRPVA